MYTSYIELITFFIMITMFTEKNDRCLDPIKFTSIHYPVFSYRFRIKYIYIMHFFNEIKH